MIFYDVESVGFNGPMTLLQYALDDGPIEIQDIWKQPVEKTLATIEWMMAHPGGVCAFNISFDHYAIQRVYNIFSMMSAEGLFLPDKDAWVQYEDEARFGPCIKPQVACDVMLWVRSTPLQALMKRKPIYVKRVPVTMAQTLAEYLTREIQFDEIYFADRRGGYAWTVEEDPDRCVRCKGCKGKGTKVTIEGVSFVKDPCLVKRCLGKGYLTGTDKFPDVVLRFGASSRLKRLGQFVLGRDTISLPTPKELHPVNVPHNFRDLGWYFLLEDNIEFWATNEEARRYGRQDVELLRDLYHHLKVVPGSTDSELACAVASARWRGFALDRPLLSSYRETQARAKESAPRAPRTVLKKLHSLLGPIGATTVKDTDKETLKRLSGVEGEVGAFARSVVAARSAEKRVQIVDKLLITGRAHLDFSVFGTLTGRMAGRGKLNPQGIPKGDALRDAFILADGELSVLDGGDFEGFEVAIAAGCYGDPALTAALKSGQKFHALFGAEVYELPYAEIMATKDEPWSGGKSRYDRAKQAVFAAFYGAQLPKLATTLGLTEKETEKGYDRLFKRFPGIREEQNRTYEQFCSMRQPKGEGTQVYWTDAQDYAESLLGDRRYFVLENKICKALYGMAQALPSEFADHSKVERRPGRIQTTRGACQTALYSCAFQIQAKTMRQAGNHRIQATGARITKELQKAIWDHQPKGIGPWKVQMLNIHDELLVAKAPEISLDETVSRVVESFRDLVPQIKMEWQRDLPSWGARA